MKEIKAYIRRDKAEAVVDQLRRSGVPEIVLLEVHAVGYGQDPNFFIEASDVFTRYRDELIKLELVCEEMQVDRLIGVVREAAASGYRGDGRIFVTEVNRAIRIHDGVEGKQALESV